MTALRVFAAALSVVLREVGKALVDAADALDAATGEETADRCPTRIPDYLLSDR